MKILNTYFLVFLLILGNLIPVYSQNRISFKHYSSIDGLNTRTVTSIVQDSSGFIWVGTDEGLKRFDGNNFKTYFISSSDISNDRIICLYIDKNSTLWVGQNSGLSKYDPLTDHFFTYKANPDDSLSLPNKMVGQIFEDSKNNFWVSTWDGLCKFDREAEEFHLYRYKNPIGQFSKYNVSIAESKDGDLWLGTLNGGIVRFNEEKGFYKQYYHKNDDPNSLGGNNIRKVYIDSENNIWIGCWMGGLNLYNPEKDNFTTFKFSNTSQGEQVSDMVEDCKGNFWVTTDYGLVLFNRKDFSYYIYRDDPKDNGSLDSPIVSRIFTDNDMGIWIGSPYEGLYYFNLRQLDIQSIKKPKIESQSFIKNIRHIYPLKNNQFLLASYNESQITDSNFTPIGKTMPIRVHYVDSENKLWIKQDNKIIISSDPKTFQPTKEYYLEDSANTEDIAIRYIIEDKKKNIILVSYNSFYKLNHEQNGFDKYNLSDFTDNNSSINNSNINDYAIGALFFDNYDSLWAVNSNEELVKLNLSNFTAKTLSRKQYDYSGRFYNMYHDSKNQLWLFTSTGLYLFDKITNKFKKISISLNGEEEIIRSGIEDHNGNFWLSSGKGLVEYNTSTGNYSYFSNEYGINGSKINTRFIKTKNNEIILGNSNNIIKFHPDSITSKKTNKVIITGLRLFNEEVEIDSTIIDKQIMYSKSITLDYKEATVITISFISINYFKARNNIYAYKLENFEDKWNYIGDKSTVNFTNLAPGKYIFKIKTKNAENNWDNNITQLEINITPPFWKTTWFKTLMITLIIALYFLSMNIRNSNIKRQKKRLEVQVKERTAEIISQKEEIEAIANNLQEAYQVVTEHKEELQVKTEELSKSNVELEKLNATKNKFFNIIAHDLKNPFQAISGFSDILIKDIETISKEENLGFLKMIKNSSTHAASLLENLLKWAQTQTNKIKFSPHVFDLHKVAESTTLLLNVTAEAKDIKIINQIPANTFVYADENMVTTILRNITNNAVKFSNTGGVITISTRKTKNFINCKIKDTGVGMDESTKNKLFKIENSISKPGTSGESGTGLGLIISKEFAERNNAKLWVESEEGKGSEFFLQIPINEQSSGKIEEFLNQSNSENIEEKEAFEIQRSVEAIPEKNTESPTILIVEDTKEIRENLTKILNKHFHIIETQNGKEGFDSAIENIPDLIVCDWMMPEMDGIELCNYLKNDERTSHIPIVMLTAKSSSQDMLDGFSTGADDYITKPFDSRILLARVFNLIKNRIQLRETFIKEFLVGSEVVPGNNELDKNFLSKAIRVVEKNIDNCEFDVSDFTKELGVSRSQLHAKLKAISNQSTSEFIRTIRLKKAAQLLVKKDMNINEVIHEVGFNERTYFSKCFNSLFGMNPSEYKKRYS